MSIVLFAHAPYARFLTGSLASILGQSYGNLEIFVLSDGSDAVSEVVRRFDDARVALRAQTHAYFLESANELMGRSVGKYLGTWNSDDIYSVDHVKCLVEAMEVDEALGGAFDNTENVSDSTAEEILSGRAESLGYMLNRTLAEEFRQRWLTVQDIVNENVMAGPASLIRKTAFEKVGGYDAKIKLNCDLHWFYRLAAYFPVRYVDYVGVRKRIHPLNNTAVNPHYEFGVRELEDIRDNYPDVYERIGKRVFDKKLGRKYYRLAKFYESEGRSVDARTMYRKASRLRPFSFRYHWELLRSLYLLVSV